jgi:N6-L-threonylcarbamoyladenine synthase
MTLILGIESSCDETAASVVENGRIVRSNIVASQTDLHARYGGVFPEMASRQHMLTITPVIRTALQEAGVEWGDIAAIAAVNGPGLAGALAVGLNVAKALAYTKRLPLVAVNHMEAHIYANWLRPPSSASAGVLQAPITDPVFPLVCLVVSGGHTDLILMRDHHDYQQLGRTIDDAAGEAFDKVARLLGLGYPGGPAIQRAAESGNPAAFVFPRALRVGARHAQPYDFSFSGLKTAVLRMVQELQAQQGATTDTRKQKLVDATVTPEAMPGLPIADIAAGFQAAAVSTLVEKTALAAQTYGVSQVLMAGGVAANRLLRSEMSRQLGVPVRYPPAQLCTDNAAMVAAAGYYRYLGGESADLGLDILPNLALVPEATQA